MTQTTKITRAICLFAVVRSFEKDSIHCGGAVNITQSQIFSYQRLDSLKCVTEAYDLNESHFIVYSNLL